MLELRHSVVDAIRRMNSNDPLKKVKQEYLSSECAKHFDGLPLFRLALDHC